MIHPISLLALVLLAPPSEIHRRKRQRRFRYELLPTSIWLSMVCALGYKRRVRSQVQRVRPPRDLIDMFSSSINDSQNHPNQPRGKPGQVSHQVTRVMSILSLSTLAWVQSTSRCWRMCCDFYCNPVLLATHGVMNCQQGRVAIQIATVGGRESMNIPSSHRLEMRPLRKYSVCPAHVLSHGFIHEEVNCCFPQPKDPSQSTPVPSRVSEGAHASVSLLLDAMADIAKGVADMEDLEGRIRKYYEERLGSYDAFWGIGNLHVGVYDDVSSMPDTSEGAKRAFFCGATRMTELMASESGMSEESVVVDLGCGCGYALLDLASTRHLKEGDGIDLTEKLVERARASASSSGRDQMLHFYQGSVLNASSILGWRKGKCTHVMSQLSLCYVHDRMQAVLHEAAELLQPGGKLVLCDLVASGSELSLDCKQRVLRRLCLDGVQMLSKTSYVDAVMQSGRFHVDSHEDLSVHLAHSYDLLSRIASSPLAEDYAASARCSREGEVGMVLVVAHKMH